MIDAMVSLAFGVHSSRGAFGLLLGSGASRSAQIPTGAEITEDLARRVARLQSSEPSDAIGWFRANYGHEPDYSELLEQLAPTAAGRRDIISGYVEPTPEEREAGAKLPQAAHRAIARMIGSGAIRFVITTNFDRLIETALTDAGVQHRVIATDDAIRGAAPLSQTGVCIFKLHGDYQDDRILNSEAELAEYSTEREAFLDSMLEQMGLIVCGWSGEYDPALVSAVRRMKNRRYPLYYAARNGSVKPQAQTILNERQGIVIDIRDADSFMTSLADQVQALDDYGGRHPLSSKTAAAITKRYIERRLPIQLSDLVRAETELALQTVSGAEFEPSAGSGEQDRVKLLQRVEVATDVLERVMGTGCYWNRELPSNDLWVKSIERLGCRPSHSMGWADARHLNLYPALRLIYAGGLAALVSGDFGLLRDILMRPILRENGRKSQMVLEATPGQIMAKLDNSYTPVSSRLCMTLLPSLAEYVPDKTEFDEVFDRFEILFALVCADLSSKTENGGLWTPPGRFAWRRHYHPAMDEFARWSESEGDQWVLLRAGFFDGSRERYRVLWNALVQNMSQLPWG